MQNNKRNPNSNTRKGTVARRCRAKIHQKKNIKSHQSSIRHQDEKIHISWQQCNGNRRTNQDRDLRCIFSLLLLPRDKNYIRIDSPIRLERDAKYVTTVPSCHWIRERSVTVIPLLTYATRNAQITQNHLKLAVREAPTKEVLCSKFAEHRCHTELVKINLKGVTEIFEV